MQTTRESGGTSAGRGEGAPGPWTALDLAAALGLCSDECSRVVQQEGESRFRQALFCAKCHVRIAPRERLYLVREEGGLGFLHERCLNGRPTSLVSVEASLPDLRAWLCPSAVGAEKRGVLVAGPPAETVPRRPVRSPKPHFVNRPRQIRRSRS